MPERGKAIHALRRKIEIIGEVFTLMGRCNGKSVIAVAKAANIEPATLNKSCQEGRITTKLERKLLEFAGFNANEFRWHDPDVPESNRSLSLQEYEGRDKLYKFRDFIFQLYNLSDTVNRKISPQPPMHASKNIATFAIEGSGQTVRPDQPLLLFFRLVMKPGYHNQTVYGFKRVRLTFFETKNLEFCDLLAEGEKIQIKNASLSVWGGKYDPEWFLSVDSGVLNGEYRGTDPLCGLKSDQVGQVLKAEISVHQHDGSLVWRDSGEELDDPAKQAVLSALCARQMEESTSLRSEEGWLSLGIQQINIVRGDA